MHANWKNVIYYMVNIVIAVLFILAFKSYTGSKVYYLLFTLSYCYLLNSSIKTMKSYSYLFLSLCLFLGFWLKFTVHSILNMKYLEPIGDFVFSPESLNEALFVSTIGCWGVILAYAIFSKIKSNENTVSAPQLKEIRVPDFYKKYRRIIGPLLFCLIIIVALWNMYAGVFMIGLTTRTFLIWPLNAVISFCLGIGFALMVTTVLWWELSYKKRADALFVFAIVEPFINSISILSRSLYLFHFGPVFLAFLMNIRGLNLKIKKRTLIAILFLSATGFLISIKYVTDLRTYYYSGAVIEKEQYSGLFATSINTIKILIVDRWIGIEGVMSVASYAHKSPNLLQEGIMEKPNENKIGIYQYIAKSKYLKIDTSKFIFGGIPGAIAFFLYSGSYWIVFIGVFALSLLMLLSEVLIARLTNNVLLIALFGMDVANTVAQFGIVPILLVKHYLFIFAYCCIVYLVQRTRQSKNELTVQDPKSFVNI